MKRLIQTITTVAVLSIATLAFAGAHQRGAGHGMGPAGHPGPGMMAALNLTTEQQQQVTDIRQKYEADLTAKRQAMADARLKVREAAQATPFNEEAIRAAHKALSAAQEEMAVTRAKMMNEIRGVLTAEQATKWDELKANRAGRPCGGMGGGMMGKTGCAGMGAGASPCPMMAPAADDANDEI